MVSLAFGKIVGIYLLIVGISLLAQRKGWMHVVKEIRKREATVRLTAMLELLIGLVIITFHGVWIPGWEIIVTIIGWLMVIEGAAYLLLPHDTIAGMMKAFNKPAWYIVGGIASVLLGAYLILVTFGLGIV